MSNYLDLIGNDNSSFDAKSTLNKAEIDLKASLQPQPIAISCGVNWNKEPLCIFGVGDYSAITGVGKSKKSFLKSALMSVYQGQKDDTMWPGWRSHREEGKMIIDIDTEQSDYHAQRAFRRVAKLSGFVDPLYKAYALRKYQPVERMQIIEEIIERYGSKIGLMCIDGYADLITDTNDADQSANLVQKLMTWTDEHKFHITGILHTNPSGDKMRGHLGSDVSRKASTVLKVTAHETDRRRSKVEHVLARDEALDHFEIEINNNGLPMVVPF